MPVFLITHTLEFLDDQLKYCFVITSLNLQLAYLPHKRRDLILDDENIELYVPIEGNVESADDTQKEKKTRKHGLLNWLKIRVCVVRMRGSFIANC